MNTRLESLLLAGLLASAGLGSAAPAAAETFWVEAPVIDVEPLTRLVEVSVPQEVCWEEPVQEAGYYGPESHTPKVLGGIIGGVIGNQFGGGRGRDVMTVAGALLGASIGNDAAKRNRPYYPGRTVMERRCEVEHVTHTEERTDGYRVTYEYAGRQFVTRSPVEPGPTIRVRVRVEPAAYNGGYRPSGQRYGPPGYRGRFQS